MELDLSQARLEPGSTSLEVNCVFGGIVLTVPESWVVQLRTSCIAGDFVDRGHVPDDQKDATRVLLVRGSCVFGGGEIKYTRP